VDDAFSIRRQPAMVDGVIHPAFSQQQEGKPQ
jgi:hypothetical protein